MNHYPIWFSTVNEILVLSTDPVSEDTIRSDDSLQTFAAMHRGVILDLSGFEYLSSKLVGTMTTVHRLLMPLKKRLRFVINNQESIEILQVTGLRDVFSQLDVPLIFDNLDDALNSDW